VNRRSLNIQGRNACRSYYRYFFWTSTVAYES